MKTFRAHTSFVPEKSKELEQKNIVILPKTDYEIHDTNQAFGVYIKVKSPIIELLTTVVYVSPEEIKKYGEVQNKLTTGELRKILDGISFADSCINFNWGWEIAEIGGAEFKEFDINYNPPSNIYTHGFLINTTFTRPDTNTGIIGIGRGRRMWIEETASETSVVMTAWVCVDLIIRHEQMEAFQYRGAKILNPHKNLEQLAYPEKLK